MLERDAIIRHRPRRLSQLQSVSDHPTGARLPRGTVRGDMQARSIRPLGQRNTAQGERGLVAEELPRLKARGVLETESTEVFRSLGGGVRTDAVER